MFFIPATWAEESRNSPSADEPIVEVRATGNPILKTAGFFPVTDPASRNFPFGEYSADALNKLHPKSSRKFSGYLDPKAGNVAEPGIVLRQGEIRDQPLTPWAGEKHFEAALKVSPMNSRGTPVQRRRTTCGLNVVMSMLRDLGGEAIAEDDFLRSAVQNSWYDSDVPDFKRGLVEGGMSSLQMTRCLRAHGARVTQSRTVPRASDLQKWLGQNKKVALKVNVGTQKDPVWHWVRLEEIKGGRAIFGDPWDGHSWEVRDSVLRRRIHPKSGTVVAEFLMRI